MEYGTEAEDLHTKPLNSCSDLPQEHDLLMCPYILKCEKKINAFFVFNMSLVCIVFASRVAFTSSALP